MLNSPNIHHYDMHHCTAALSSCIVYTNCNMHGQSVLAAAVIYRTVFNAHSGHRECVSVSAIT